MKEFWPGVAVGVVAVLLIGAGVWIGYCKGVAHAGPAKGPAISPDMVGVIHDPPIIIHGGSFHIGAISVTDPLLSNGRIGVGVDDRRPAYASGYYSATTNATPIKLPQFTSNWEVDLCTDDSCKQGLRVCSNATTNDTCNVSGSLAPTPAGTITVMPLSSGDAIQRSGAPRQFQFERRFGFFDGKGSNAYYPKYLRYTQDNQAMSPLYPCGVIVTSFNPTAPPITDWSTCWVEMGQFN
jgi:hypothetical protein